MHRRGYLTGIATAATLGLAGCGGGQSEPGDGKQAPSEESPSAPRSESPAGPSAANDFAIRYNYKQYRCFSPRDNQAISYDAEDGKEYAVAQLAITNLTGTELSLGQTELATMDGGSGADISFYQVGDNAALEDIAPGETTDTWVSYVVAAGASLTFGPTQWAQHSFELEEDAGLEIGVVPCDRYE